MTKQVTNNLSVSNVGTVLTHAGGTVTAGRASTFFADAAKINRWSYYKPMAGGTANSRSEEVIKQCNDGFTITEVPTSGLLAEIAGGFTGTWVYKPPTTQMRLGDFRGYDAAQWLSTWFKPRFMQTAGKQGASIKFQFDKLHPLDLDLWAVSGRRLGITYEFGFIFQQGTEINASATSFMYFKVGMLSFLDDDSFNYITLDADAFPTKDASYVGYPVLRKATSQASHSWSTVQTTDASTWYALPSTPTCLYVTSSEVADIGTLLSLRYLTGYYDTEGGMVSNIYLGFSVINKMPQGSEPLSSLAVDVLVKSGKATADPFAGSGEHAWEVTQMSPNSQDRGNITINLLKNGAELAAPQYGGYLEVYWKIEAVTVAGYEFSTKMGDEKNVFRVLPRTAYLDAQSDTQQEGSAGSADSGKLDISSITNNEIDTIMA